MRARTNRFSMLALAGALLFTSQAEARHWQWAYAEQGHATSIVGFYQPSPQCLNECGPLISDPSKADELKTCTAKYRCQPLVDRPPNPDLSSNACQPGDVIADDGQFDTQCSPYSTKIATLTDPALRYSRGSCCLQYEIGRLGWRGYQLTYGPYDMDSTVNDQFTCAFARVPNADNLTKDGSTYEYMVGFEFWQYRGSHHFIMDDLLGKYNDPGHPRDCATASNPAECVQFDQLPESDPVSQPKPSCTAIPGAMRSFPLAGSPGPSYFPVPYPDGVGIKISRNHIFRMTHHLQDWFDPQTAQVWINVYTKPAEDAAGNQNIQKEAHVFFDGSGSVFLVPPHTIGRTSGLWVAPRNIELYGLTAHSHKRNVLFAADLVGVDGQVKSLPVRTYQYSNPVCGGLARIPSGANGQPQPNDPVDYQHPPRHLFESIDWAEHEQCPYWREDGGNNDGEGAILVKQGEGIRYECLVNNGVLPIQILNGTGLPPKTGDPTIDPLLANVTAGAKNAASYYPAGTLAFQAVPVEPRDAFGRVPRVKFSCEEIPGVIPGFPGAGAVGYYGNRPCMPNLLKGQDPSLDFTSQETAEAALLGGSAGECCHRDPDDTSTTCDQWTQFRQPWFSGTYTGKCVPSSIGFAETEDDEMCILLGLYTFTDDDAVPIGTNGPLGEHGIDRLPTDVGR